MCDAKEKFIALTEWERNLVADLEYYDFSRFSGASLDHHRIQGRAEHSQLFNTAAVLVVNQMTEWLLWL